MSTKREQFLLTRIRVFKDDSAFRELYQEHAGGLYRFLCIKLPSHHDAEDALGTTFVRTWHYICRTEVESFSGLLFTIARGVIAEFYRKRPDEASLEVLKEEGFETADEKASENQIEVQAEAALIKEGMKHLSSDEQAYLALRYFEGLSLKEIGERVQKSENAVRVAIHRALRKLRSHFDSHDGKTNYNSP